MKLPFLRKLDPIRLGLTLAALIAAVSLCTPYPARLVHELRRPAEPTVRVEKEIVEVPVEVIVRQPVPTVAEAAPELQAKPWQPDKLISSPQIELPPFPPALPEKLETGSFEHITALAKGLHLRSTLSFHQGSTASLDRKKKNAFLIKLSVDMLLPHAADGHELASLHPNLPKTLLKYGELMQHARVSRWFHSLYLHKQNHTRKSIATLAQPLDKHNFFDTDTILEITAPDSRRRVLWLQADMDVVSDGSDGDRLPTMPEAIRKSDHYQPTTSYRWKKTGSTPNPLLPHWESRLTKLQKEKTKNAAAIDYARRVIWDLKKYSYLLAQYDPFIVIPLTFKEGKDDTYRPEPGDYAAVIVGTRVFPAIVGDYGPKHKTGEASLRLAKLINPKADVYARPVSGLDVSYLIFPHSKEPQNGPIDYARLNSRCRELLDEIGGISPQAEFVEAVDLLAPKPPPPAKEEENSPAVQTNPTPSPTPQPVSPPQGQSPLPDLPADVPDPPSKSTPSSPS